MNKFKKTIFALSFVPLLACASGEREISSGLYQECASKAQISVATIGIKRLKASKDEMQESLIDSVQSLLKINNGTMGKLAMIDFLTGVCYQKTINK